MPATISVSLLGVSAMQAKLTQRLFAEFFGTFTLVFCGCGAVSANAASNGDVGHLGISIAFGLVVMIVIYCIGDISGAHINPAVTIGFWAARRFPGKEIAPYVLVQCVAAIAGAGLLALIFGVNGDLGMTRPSGTWEQSFALEVVLTFLLMWVILNMIAGPKLNGVMVGVVVGATIALEALFGGPISGASMNPARSLGPAMGMTDLNEVWIYLVAPPIGALLAVPATNLARPASEVDSQS